MADPFRLQSESCRLEFKEGWPGGAKVARTAIGFDKEPQYHVPWERLDLSSCTEAFRKATGRELDDAAYLNLGLVTEDRDGRDPTAAAILLSEGAVKQRTFPNAKIECARFKGTPTKVLLYHATFDGSVHASNEPCISIDLLDAVGYKTRARDFKKRLSRLIDHRLIEMTIPDKPRRSRQKYRLTTKGMSLRDEGASEK